MFERRNHTRRSVCGGLVLGALAGLLLAIIETLTLFIVARPSLAIAGGPFRFGPPLLGLTVGVGAAVGLVQGLAVAFVEPLSEWLARKRIRQPRWSAMLYSALLTPGVAWVCAEAFSGRRAKQLPAHDALVVGAGIVTLGILYVAFRALHEVRIRLGASRWMHAASAALLLIALTLLAVDRSVLPRLYGFFHVTLEVLVFAALELAILAASLALHAGERRWGRLAAPSAAIAIALVGVTGAALGLARFRAPDAGALRMVAHDHGSVSGRLLDLARLVGFPAVVAPASAASPRNRSPIATDGVRLPDADLILITIDALRADHVGAYGYQRATTPRLDALAKESIVFERAYAAVPHTSFSIASLMTGKFAWSLAALGLFDGHHETLPDALRQYGYATAGFFPPAVFFVDGDRFKKLEQRHYGFDFVRYEPFHETLDAPSRTDQVIRFLDTDKPSRVVLWVHYFGPHEPYVEHPENGPSFGDRAVDRYDGEIRWVDGEVGRLIEYVKKTRPNAVIVVTADHGEEFGEHGGAYHGTTLFDEQLRVPLILFVPGLPPKRISSPVSTVDVLPTLLSLVDVPPSARVRGTDLTPWLDGAPREASLPPVFAEIDSLKMVADKQEKLICDAARGYCRLYDLTNDPAETRDLAQSRKDRVEALQGLLAGWMESHGEMERALPTEDAATAARRRSVERAELGDREAIPQVIAALADSNTPLGLRASAARVLARLPDPKAREALVAARSAGDHRLAAWATVALATLGDSEAIAVARTLSGEPELHARAALARASARDVGAVDALIRAIPATQDVELRRELLRALGRTRDPAAVATLLAAYEPVRTRKYAAIALGDLGDKSVVPFLLERLPVESYTSVRAAIAHALGQIRDPSAREPLERLFATDKETQVQASSAWALVQLGEGRSIRGPTTLTPPPGKTEAWLVLKNGDIQASITVDGTALDVGMPRDAYMVPVSGPVKVAGAVGHVLWR